ncbi:MAG: hypothetical protein ATN35_01830 [Epulopiscium sp. Nele67-Bin004]|nr:MAG: hypothetical protein ATN35_01830 [Epulopiscium sp. Nele67-Bin004]
MSNDINQKDILILLEQLKPAYERIQKMRDDFEKNKKGSMILLDIINAKHLENYNSDIIARRRFGQFSGPVNHVSSRNRLALYGALIQDQPL